MKKLKEKIMKTLQKCKNVESVLSELSKSQENLLKNYSNSVFSKKDRGKLLRAYMDIRLIVIIIQSFIVLFFENISIKNITMCEIILICIRRIVIRTDVPSNISKNTLFSYVLLNYWASVAGDFARNYKDKF